MDQGHSLDKDGSGIFFMAPIFTVKNLRILNHFGKFEEPFYKYEKNSIGLNLTKYM